MNQDSAAEVNPSLHQIVSTEVVLSERAFIIATETAFHRVNTGVAFKLVKNWHSSCRLFCASLIPKSGIVVNKKGTYAGEDEWEQSRLFRCVGNSAAVHKNIFPATVTVVVAKHRKLPFLRELDDELLGKVNAGVKNFRGGLPSTI